MHRIIIALAVASSLLLWPAGRNLLPEPLRVVLSSFASEPTTKEGCGMDPNGLHCATAPQPEPETDAGCGMDPNGCPKGS
jgi:hypothetical protein